MIAAINTEVTNLALKAAGATAPTRTSRIFNADLIVTDAAGNVHPYLAESLPQLDTDSWQVQPDGRMQTTWKLRPGLTWQDGSPLTADDFVFASQVYGDPALTGIFVVRPQNLIERVVALDPQTLEIDWRAPYQLNTSIANGGMLPPLPRSILGASFSAFTEDPTGQRDAFMAQRFWTTEYVGAGPFRLTNWVPGSYLEGAAFDGHALGRPKIDKIQLRLINDASTVLAGMLSGDLTVTMVQAIKFQQAMVLRDQAGFNGGAGKGKLVFTEAGVTSAFPQFRPEYQQTPGLLDPRVRQALASAIDRQAIDDGIFDGQAPIPYAIVTSTVPYYAQIDSAIAKYPYDPAKAAQLMTEAGFTRGSTGFFVGPNGEPFQPAFWNSAGAQKEQVMDIVVDTWKQAGIDSQPFVLPAALEQSQQARATFPGMLVYNLAFAGTVTSADKLTSPEIATPANNWNGQNRGGWSNTDFDTLFDRYSSTLQPADQIDALVRMMKVYTEQVANMPLFYEQDVVSHQANLRGPEGDSSNWNIYAWELTS